MVLRTISLFLCCCLAYPLLLHAQYNRGRDFLNTNSVWAFGTGGGLDKKNGQPFRSALGVPEGCASVADRSSGRLLFYSDGQAACYNRNHTPMPNGSGLLGNSGSTTQGACIVPFIDSADKYYLFSLGSFEGREGKLYYSVVDMSLDNGLGDIPLPRKNILIDSGLCESMIAIPGSSCDIWLMVHRKDSAYFKAYHITQSGLDLSPVVSYTGQQIQYSGTYGSGTPAGAYRQGAMAVSPDRRLIAIASQSVPAYQGLPSMGALLCRFDPVTGIVSDGIVVEGGASCFSVIFSPDQSKLYTCGDDPSFGRSIFQYDISVYNSAAIAASKTYIGPLASGNITFKLYRDTIYLPEYPAGVLNRINRPDLAGAACELQDSAVMLLPGTSAWTCLPNDVVYPLPADTIRGKRLDTLLCSAGAQKTEITLAAPSGFLFYEWQDGVTERIRTFTEPGTYYVMSRNFCHLYIDTFVVRGAHFLLGADTAICNYDTPLLLQVSVPGGSYTWQDGSTADHYYVTDPGAYWVTVAVEGCRAADTIQVAVINVDQHLGNDTFFCSYDSIRLRLQAAMPPGAQALWEDGSTRIRHEVSGPGSYWVQVRKDGCVGSDTIRITQVHRPQDLGADLFLCKDEPVDRTLAANAGSGSRIAWSDGSTGQTLPVRDTGAYWVTVTDRTCAWSDTVVIGQEVCDCLFDMPTAFSPNGDGRNDVFRPFIEAGCPVREFTLQVYDRWGQLLYSGKDPVQGWDGTYDGSPAEIGTYMYRVQFAGGTKGKEQTRKGDVTLIR